MSAEALTTYPALEARIQSLREFAEPLAKRTKITPILPVVNTIIALDPELTGKTPAQIAAIESIVRDCERLLDELSLRTTVQNIAKVDPSEVFKILASSNAFANALKKMQGKGIELPDGTTALITPLMIEQLVRYRFSIGTPPITPEGIDAIEEIVFGTGLHDIYAFRNLFGGDTAMFDRFMGTVSQMLEQSTHYTTAAEKESFEDESVRFNDLANISSLSTTVVSGTAASAIRLIKNKLFDQHENGSRPIRVIEEVDKLDDELIALMKQNPDKVYVVRVTKVPDNIFSNEVLQEKWRGVIGRLILVDDTDKGQRSDTCLVYSVIPKVTETLAKIHVKDSGTPANPQMNLRLLLENFKKESGDKLKQSVEAKIAELEAEGVHTMGPEEVRTKEWLVTAQKDYFSLKRFLEFLNFVLKIRDAEKADLAAFKQELSDEVAGLTMDYFFKALKEGNLNPDPPYSCITVPQGGGRRELGLVAEFHSKKCNSKLDTFRESQLEACESRLIELKIAAGINPNSTVDEHIALNLAMTGMESPSQALRTPIVEHSRLQLQVQEAAHHALQGVITGGETLVDFAINHLDQVLGSNVPGLLKSKVAQLLKSVGIEAAAKQLERGRFRSAARALRNLEGHVSRTADSIAGKLTDKLKVLNSNDLQSLSEVERMLNLIKKDKFAPTVATAEVGWTWGDVFDPEVYPEKNYLRIPLSANGDLDPDALEKQLERKEEDLAAFPELFELYRASIILIVNDPHNPTGRVLPYEKKIKLLQVASRFGLSILSDEAYRCQVDKEIKDRQGYPSLAEFYEEHRTFFPKPITIHTSLSTTKWGMRAGGRTGVLVSNEIASIKDGDDESGCQEQNYAEFIGSSIDSVNSMSLYLDKTTLISGLEVKSICAKLEEATVYADAVKVLDEVLAALHKKRLKPNFCSSIYFDLIEARNHLDRLKRRNAKPHDYRKFTSKLISSLKGLRLEKRTQKDAAKRSQAAIAAVKRVAGISNGTGEKPIYEQYLDSVVERLNHIGLSPIIGKIRGTTADEEEPVDSQEATSTVYDRFIEPQGPFYFCIKLDESGSNPALQPFLEKIAKARKIDVVPQANGLVRFALGGFADGTEKGYELLSLAIETDLKLLIDYWEKTKAKIAALEKAKDTDPVETALQELFPGGEIEFVRTFQEKAPLVEALTDYYLIKNLPGGKKEFEKDFKGKPLGIKTAAAEQLKGKNPGTRKPLVHSLVGDQNLSEYFSKIEPDSPATIVTVRLDEATCRSTEDFIKSPQFQDLFNHYLLEVGSSVPALSTMNNGQLLEKFGAHIFHDLFRTRNYAGISRDVLDEVMVKVMNQWFSDSTIKVLALSSESKLSPLDVYTRVQRHITHFIEAFTTAAAAARINIRPTFQVGYEEIRNVKADPNLPDWTQGFIEETPFAGETVATDESPQLVTGGAARVAGFERGIYRRDGDGIAAPKASYFSNRLSEFKEKYNRDEFICKMVQIGPTRMMMIIHKSYEHYMAEELRLFPQFDCSIDDLGKLRPDSISFLGLPHKVMGDDYRIGTYMDQCKDGRQLPVSWVDRENISDYMGYLKKPVLTNSNEAVKALDGLPVHGGAVRINFKKGPSKSGCEFGDSGTGKSEEYIAMAEKIIASGGGWENVESIELIAGDMISLWRGADGEVYMIGTEAGDFMRMTDIGEDWQTNLRDLIAQSSTTNKDHPTNPRTTVPGLCDPNVFLKPVRLNFAFLFDNFNIPPGSSFQEEESAKNLLTIEYPKGYRREKGTSGDQPNLKASILFSKNPRREELIAKYGVEQLKVLDELLGWDLLLAPSGKVQNGILKFRDIPNQVFKAKRFVNEMFKGQHISLAGQAYEITGTEFNVENACFKVVLKGDDSKKKTVDLDRAIFDQLFPPVASTYCGNPFVSPEGMGERLAWFAEAMDEADVITGKIYTQLAVPGRQYSGPAKAADDHRTMLQRDKRVNARFQKQKETVISALAEKYGRELLGEGDLPERLMFYNIRQYEEQQSANVHLIDRNGDIIPLKTPKFTNEEPVIDPVTGKTKPFEFKPTLIVPEVATAIQQICRTETLDRDIETDLDRYQGLVADSKEELIYQILIKKGQFGVRYPAANLYKIRAQVKVAEEIANRIWVKNP